MSKQSSKFVTGALILTVAGIASKLINMFFKLPLHANIGDEGLAFYYAPYPIYTIFMALFLGGVAAAMSKLVSEEVAFGRYGKARDIFHYMLKMLVVIGIISTVLLFIFGDFIVAIAGWDSQTIHTLRGMSLSPFILAIIGGYRGYFQGLQDMKPAAFSQIIESVLKVFIGILLVRFLLQSGATNAQAAGGAAWGLTIGSFAAMIFLMIYYMVYKKRLAKKLEYQSSQETGYYVSKKEILMHLCWIAIPIAIGSACYTFINLVDSFTIIKVLKGLGYGNLGANAFMSQKIKADTFINIPMVISMSLVVSIIPAISECKALGNHKMVLQKIDMTSKIGYLIALPATLGVMVLAGPLMRMIFFTDPSGVDVLIVGSLCILFITMAQCYTAILQGIGKIYHPLLNLVVAVLVKLGVNLLLINDQLTVKGAMIGSVIAYFVLAVMSYYQVRKFTGYKIHKKLVLKGLISAAVMVVFTVTTKTLLSKYINHIAIVTLASVSVGVLTYTIAVIKLNILSEQDFEEIPMGNKIYNIMKKWS